MTEAEKGTLDAFRIQDKHPASTNDDLPEEVQGYIAGLEMAVYHGKQDALGGRCIVFSLIGAALLQ